MPIHSTVPPVLVILAAASVALPANAQDQDHSRFRADLVTTSTVVAPPAGRCDDEPGRAPVVGLVKVSGAGDATFVGAAVDEQSHCVRADLTFFGGRFTLTNAKGETVAGRYFGQLVPTFNATMPPSGPPAGQWLIFGNVCIADVSARSVRDDCAAGRYQPARGITNLDTGDGTIFLDHTIRLRR